MKKIILIALMCCPIAQAENVTADSKPVHYSKKAALIALHAGQLILGGGLAVVALPNQCVHLHKRISLHKVPLLQTGDDFLTISLTSLLSATSIKAGLKGLCKELGIKSCCQKKKK